MSDCGFNIALLRNVVAHYVMAQRCIQFLVTFYPLFFLFSFYFFYFFYISCFSNHC